jgi:hypothetical protein
VRDQVSHPYKTTGIIIVHYIQPLNFREETEGQKILKWTVASTPRT